jgi:hypothetical protein
MLRCGFLLACLGLAVIAVWAEPGQRLLLDLSSTVPPDRPSTPPKILTPAKPAQPTRLPPISFTGCRAIIANPAQSQPRLRVPA